MLAKNMKEFHRIVTERDNYVCCVCKKDFAYSCYFLPDGRNSHVCADHIHTQGSSPELKLETNNGRCICLPCHNLRHSKGLKQNEHNTNRI